MLSPWTWFFATLLGVLVAAAIGAAINEAKRHTSPALSGATLPSRTSSLATGSLTRCPQNTASATPTRPSAWCSWRPAAKKAS